MLPFTSRTNKTIQLTRQNTFTLVFLLCKYSEAGLINTILKLVHFRCSQHEKHGSILLFDLDIQMELNYLRTRLKSYLKATTVVDILPMRSIVSSSFPIREDIGQIEYLAESIKNKGVLEPIIVRPLGSRFEIVAGHRRFAACRLCGLSEIPAIIISLTDKEAFEVALEENLQRKTLDPIEEAKAFKLYVQKYGHGSVTELAKIIGKSQEYVSHRIMLLKLPAEVQEQIRRRLLSSSDAWELSRLNDPSRQEKLAAIAVEKKLTVRQLREAANLSNAGLPIEEALKKIDEEDKTASYSSSSHVPNEIKRAKVKKAASTILRVSMIRIDNLIASLGKDNADLKEQFQRLRFAIHQLIDEYIGERIYDRQQTVREITSLVLEKFLNSFNSQNISEISNLRSDYFTMFDDFPPLALMDFEKSEKHDRTIFKKMKDSRCSIKDLKVITFAGGLAALTTFIFCYDVWVNGFRYNRQSRVTFVLECCNNGWKIVHEHWSQADPLESSSEDAGKIATPLPTN